MQLPNTIVIVKILGIILVYMNGLVQSENLSCYQCTKNTNSECTPGELLSCPAISDRCVTHITKYANTGFTIKRECGLGPCGFNDDMVDKGLGFDKCDRSKDEYFCILCCKGSGCNKSSSLAIEPKVLLILIMAVIVVLSVVKNFQPPYLPIDE